MATVRASAGRAHACIASQSGDPLELLRLMKFDQIGFHPLEDRALNLIEQINQTWTFAVAIAAARQLLELHPDAGGFLLTPGAHASLELDIMSEVEEAPLLAAVQGDCRWQPDRARSPRAQPCARP
jgi:hypothetical protein